MEQTASSTKWARPLVVAGAGALITWGLATEHRQQQALTELHKQLSALRDAAPAGPGVVRELRTVVREREPDPTATMPSAAIPQVAEAKHEQPELTPEEAQYRADAVVAARDKAFAESYQREAPDTAWSGTATNELVAAFSGPDFDGLSLRSECKTTLCRVTFSYSDPTKAEQWRNLRTKMPWAGATSATVNFETSQGTFFISREGYDLPTFDPASVVF